MLTGLFLFSAQISPPGFVDFLFTKYARNMPLGFIVKGLFYCYNKGIRRADMYIYYNPNPQHINAGDCVIRAIAKAFEIPWTNAYIALCLQGYMKGDWGSSNPVWDSYLREQGFKRYVIPNTCPDCYTVEKFAYDHPEGLYILITLYVIAKKYEFLEIIQTGTYRQLLQAKREIEAPAPAQDDYKKL